MHGKTKGLSDGSPPGALLGGVGVEARLVQGKSVFCALAEKARKARLVLPHDPGDDDDDDGDDEDDDNDGSGDGGGDDGDGSGDSGDR